MIRVSYQADDTTTEHAARRIAISTAAPFELLRRRFEELVPAVSLTELRGEAEGGNAWEAIRRGAEWNAPYGLCRFWSDEPTVLMRVAGNDTPSATYLVGSLTLQARLFRHSPATMLYFPVRIELHQERTGRTVVGFEQPGAQLAGFGINKVTQAGYELDRLLGDLLEALDLPRPAALRR